ncbi:MAG TPA: hypothetical protein VFU04_00550 [Solirubrobacterales bacterium]|nr:hypothetical protein [Solirubrobacterales bacterium]
MSAPREIPEPGELVHAPRPSWAPVFFAFGAALALCGVFAQGFMFRGWIYSIAGIVIALAALRTMVRDARREFYSRPRRQKARGAVLPVEQIRPPSA